MLKVVEKIKAHIVCSVFFFFFENHTVYETMKKTYVEPSRPQITTWHMRIASWIPKTINANSEYAILIVFYVSNGPTTAPQCYVIRILPMLFVL